MSLTLTPITLKEACAFVARVHRHHTAPQGGLFAVAVSAGDEVCGVAIVGRPVARMLDDGWTAEVTRLATDGSRNACSMLYAAAWRACRALGWKKLITYLLGWIIDYPEADECRMFDDGCPNIQPRYKISETGRSVTAAGWKCVGEAGGGNWSRKDRPRVDLHPTQGKLRFEVRAAGGGK